MRSLRAVPPSAVFLAAAFLAGCGKATVRPGPSDPDFSLGSLRAGTSALTVSGRVRVTEFRKSFEEAFGSGDALAASLSALILDSLNRGVPAVPARAAAPEIAGLIPADMVDTADAADATNAAAGAPSGSTPLAWTTETPRHILRVRHVTVGKATREVPTAILPAVGQNSMAPAGGGTSESAVVAFDVEVWEVRNENGAAGMTRRASFSVTGQSDVVLYAYKSALIEAVNAAASKTASHLRNAEAGR